MPAASASRAPRAAVPLLVAVLLVAHWTLAVAATRGKTTTYDEIAHLPAGYAYWTLGDYRLNPENGILPQRLGALPLLGRALHFPEPSGPDWEKSNVWSIGRRFFFELGNDLDAMLLSARATMASLSVLTGLVVFLWARRLHGAAGGLVALTLFAFCPTFLAHGPLVTSDAATALLLTLAVASTWWLLHGISPARVLCTGLAWGGLALAKFSAPLLAPIAALLVAVRLSRRDALPLRLGVRATAVCGRLRQAAALGGAFVCAAAIAFLLLWAAYGFRYAAFAQPDAHAELLPGWDWVAEHQMRETRLPIAVVERARAWKLLPEAYLYGFSHSFLRAQARSAFLDGDYRNTGWWQFFPYAFAVKTPLATLGVWLVACAAFASSAWAARGRWSAVGRALYRTAPLWAIVLVYGAACLTSRLNIGHRHLLPLYPALFVLAGAAIGAGAWRPVRRAAVVGLLALLVAESLAVYPHYLAFFNAAAGGPRRGYRHLVDSSLDWGQDLPGLRDWLDAQRLAGSSPSPVYLSYFGSGSPAYYGIDATLLPQGRDPWPIAPLRGGVYCISATNLQGVYLRDAPGPAWTPLYEQRYQQAAARIGQLQATRDDPSAFRRLVAREGEAYWARLARSYGNLRAGRLFAHLRQREPDASVGHSILIYRLDDAEVERAIDPAQPPPELRKVPWAPDPT